MDSNTLPQMRPVFRGFCLVNINRVHAVQEQLRTLNNCMFKLIWPKFTKRVIQTISSSPIYLHYFVILFLEYYYHNYKFTHSHQRSLRRLKYFSNLLRLTSFKVLITLSKYLYFYYLYLNSSTWCMLFHQNFNCIMRFVW